MSVRGDILKTRSNLYSVGAGTIWFGRKWPPEANFFSPPSMEEIENYIKFMTNQGYKNKNLVVDTASAYGHSEKMLGHFLARNNNWRNRIFLCTKWGEKWQIENPQDYSGPRKGTIDHTTKNLDITAKKSISILGSLDLLYCHQASLKVIKNQEIATKMRNFSKFIGVSISSKEVMLESFTDRLITNFDVIQLPTWMFLENSALISNFIVSNKKMLVLNSPVRNSKTDPDKSFANIINKSPLFETNNRPLILNGSRNHYKQNLKFMSKLIKGG